MALPNGGGGYQVGDGNLNEPLIDAIPAPVTATTTTTFTAAQVLNGLILVNSGMPPAEVFAELPGGYATPELRLAMPESRHAEFMDKVMSATAEFEYAEINTLDGMRADFVDSWGLIRPSNTTPCLTLRFEGDDAEALEDVKTRFRKMIQSIDPSLKLPF